MSFRILTRGARLKPAHIRARGRRRVYRRLPKIAIPGYAPICWDSNDPSTMDAAFRSRLLRDLPQADCRQLLKLKAFVQNWLSENLTPLSRIMSTGEWFDSLIGKAPPERIKELKEVYEKLRGEIPTDEKLRVKCFMKTECYASFMKAARAIMSRSDYYKVFIGPVFKSIEEEVYKLPYFVKHLTPEQRIERILGLKSAMGLNDLCFETDFTAFESSFHPDIMDALEFQLYDYMLADFPHIAKNIREVLGGVNHLGTRIGVEAEVAGMRMSGEMNTSLGNGFSNLMLFLFLCHEAKTTGTGVVEGDDGLFVTPAKLTAEMYEKLGFDIKICQVTDPCLANFCGLTFADSGQVIRDPYRFLQKFAWTATNINAGERIMYELMRAKALSAIHETPHCPIIGVMARKALEIASSGVVRWEYDGYHDFSGIITHLGMENTSTVAGKYAIKDVHTPPFAPTWSTRTLFADMFHIEPEVQMLVESAISRGDFEEVSSLIPAPHEQVWYESRYVH